MPLFDPPPPSFVSGIFGFVQVLDLRLDFFDCHDFVSCVHTI